MNDSSNVYIAYRIPRFKTPYTYTGGKRGIAHFVWMLLGDPDVYVEPFFGGGAVFLNRPVRDPSTVEEHISDIDGLIINFWRAVKMDKDGLLRELDRPMSCVELQAMFRYVKRNTERIEKMEDDDQYYDTKVAAAFAYVMSLAMPFTWSNTRTHMLSGDTGGITRMGLATIEEKKRYIDRLFNRVRYARMHRKDWKELISDIMSVYVRRNRKEIVGVYLDPPYCSKNRKSGLYRKDSKSVESSVFEWCKENGKHRRLRIVLSTYNDYDELLEDGWERYVWRRDRRLEYEVKGKVEGSKEKRQTYEYVYASPACIKQSLFKEGINDGSFWESDERGGECGEEISDWVWSGEEEDCYRGNGNGRRYNAGTEMGAGAIERNLVKMDSRNHR